MREGLYEYQNEAAHSLESRGKFSRGVMLVMNLGKRRKGIQNSRDTICKQERPKRAVWLGNPELGMIVLKRVGQEWQEKKLERS